MSSYVFVSLCRAATPDRAARPSSAAPSAPPAIGFAAIGRGRNEPAGRDDLASKLQKPSSVPIRGSRQEPVVPVSVVDSKHADSDEGEDNYGEGEGEGGEYSNEFEYEEDVVSPDEIGDVPPAPQPRRRSGAAPSVDMAIRVVVRKRPISRSELQRGDYEVLDIEEGGQVFVNEPKTKVCC